MWVVSLDQKSNLSPPPINSPPPPPPANPFSILLVSPSSSSKNLFPLHSLSSIPLLLPYPPPPPPQSATWAGFRSLRSQVAIVSGGSERRFAARDWWHLTSCQPVGPRGHRVTAGNSLADRNPLSVAPFSIGSHPYGEGKELRCIVLPLPNYLPLDVLAAVNIWQTHVLRKWLNFNVTGSLVIGCMDWSGIWLAKQLRRCRVWMSV